MDCWIVHRQLNPGLKKYRWSIYLKNIPAELIIKTGLLAATQLVDAITNEPFCGFETPKKSDKIAYTK